MLVVDWMTIHFGDEIPSHSEAEIGRSRLFRQLERNAKTRKLFRLRSKRIFPGKPDPANACPIHFVLGILPIDPASLPVGRMQQARFPPGLLCRFRHLAGRIPDADGPVISFPRLQRRSFVSNSDGLVGLRFSAVPEIRMSCTQQIDAAGHQNLVCRLFPVALTAVALPREVRLGGVDAQRVLPVFAAQVNGRCRSGYGYACQEHKHTEKSPRSHLIASEDPTRVETLRATSLPRAGN